MNSKTLFSIAYLYLLNLAYSYGVVLCPKCVKGNSVDLFADTINQCELYCIVAANATDSSAQNAYTIELDLICRSENFLVLLIKTDVEIGIFDVISFMIQEVRYDDVEIVFEYIPGGYPIAKILRLQQSTGYIVAATLFRKDTGILTRSKYYRYKTLSNAYVPEEIKDIQLAHVETDLSDPKKVSVLIEWEPAEDRTCYYEVLSVVEDDNHVSAQQVFHHDDLFYCEIFKIPLGSRLEVGIQAKRIEPPYYEGVLFWKTLQLPTCFEFYDNDLTKCPPEKPENIQVELIHIFKYDFRMIISWKKPQLLPDYYQLFILVISESFNPFVLKRTVSGNETQLDISRINLNGFEVETHIQAYSKGGVSTAMLGKAIPRVEEENSKDIPRIIAFGVAVLCCLFILPMAVFLVYRKSQNQPARNEIKHINQGAHHGGQEYTVEKV